MELRRLVGKDGEAGQTGTSYWWSGGLEDRGIKIPFPICALKGRRPMPCPFLCK
jgi:hypothetical protein